MLHVVPQGHTYTYTHPRIKDMFTSYDRTTSTPDYLYPDIHGYGNVCISISGYSGHTIIYVAAL